MIIEIKVPTEVEITILEIKAQIRSWENAIVNGIEDTNGDLIPCRYGDSWQPKIDIDNGIIVDWEQGKTAKIHYKVCDSGTYTLLDEGGNIVQAYDGPVRNIACPEENGYGDYIIMNINENGQILNWPETPDVSDFFEE